MQLCVIDDLINEHKNIVKKYPDNKEKSAAYLTGFLDCAKRAQVISDKEYQAFKVQVLELKQC